ncbi:hypothetical protein EVAR_92527_1 [Eumeta japonica]|uniref:Uncharacterized protein n=1 Tax=Eumeta variegata TaxID=151549 RepID=A0A4C1T947_EUMVA|nr:hypothetical protein EVAR_92527_1 [Eumeta japonica]
MNLHVKREIAPLLERDPFAFVAILRDKLAKAVNFTAARYRKLYTLPHKLCNKRRASDVPNSFYDPAMIKSCTAAAERHSNICMGALSRPHARRKCTSARYLQSRDGCPFECRLFKLPLNTKLFAERRTGYWRRALARAGRKAAAGGGVWPRVGSAAAAEMAGTGTAPVATPDGPAGPAVCVPRLRGFPPHANNN